MARAQVCTNRWHSWVRFPRTGADPDPEDSSSRSGSIPWGRVTTGIEPIKTIGEGPRRKRRAGKKASSPSSIGSQRPSRPFVNPKWKCRVPCKAEMSRRWLELRGIPLGSLSTCTRPGKLNSRQEQRSVDHQIRIGSSTAPMGHAVQAGRTRQGPKKQPAAPCVQTGPHSRGRPDPFGALRRPLQLDDRQVHAARQVAPLPFDYLPDIATHLGLWRGTRRPPWPARTWLDARGVAGTIAANADLVGCCGPQPLVRARADVPLAVKGQLPAHALVSVRDQPRAARSSGIAKRSAAG